MAFSLEGLAAVAVLAGPAVAARALAAATAARRSTAAPLDPVLVPLMAELADRAREQTGGEAYGAASAEGSGWALLQALDRTLPEFDEGDHPPGIDAPAPPAE